MKNVFVYEFSQCVAPVCNVSENGAKGGLFSSNPNQLISYFYHNNSLYELVPHDNTLKEVFSSNEHYADQDCVPVGVGMCYLIDTESVCVALSDGHVFNIPTDGSEVEQLLLVEHGIQVMSWSPDQGVVVFLTPDNKIKVMTATFDELAETVLMQKGFGEKEFIDIGWGRKETQFHGSEGKAAAKAQQTVEQSEVAGALDDGYPCISWRGDGELFAVNSRTEDKLSRCIRIFGRLGQLLYTSELIPGLEGNLSWRPTGSVMACTQRLPNKHVVCFVEKNGLRHGDFTLPFPVEAARVCDVQFNAESSLLMVLCEPARNDVALPGLSEGQSSILVYSTSNYHWYLKQRFDMKPDHKAITVMWDLVLGSVLHVWCYGGHYIRYDFSHRVDSSHGLCNRDGALVAVIDGEYLQLTSFRHSVIPPPMCGTKIKLPSAALEVMFAPLVSGTSCNTKVNSITNSESDDSIVHLGSDINNICVFMSDGTVAALSHTQESSHVLVGTLHIDWNGLDPESSSYSLHHWVWITVDTMVCCLTHESSNFLCVLELMFSETLKSRHLVVRDKMALENSVLGMVPGTYGTCMVQLSNQNVFQFCVADSSWTLHSILPQPCAFMMSCLIKDCDGNMEEVLLSLSAHHCLYLNNTKVMSVVTSVAKHSQFLLLTTTHNELLCCPWTRSALLALSKEGLNAVGNGISSRRLERGSRLIAVVPDGTRVIIQMPRGNLECIEPRALSLHLIAQLLDNKSYYEAFDLARKQRINLNIFVDHDPATFLLNMATFIDSINNPQWLCLFFADLQEEDCTTTMYSDHYPQPRVSSLENKVHTVCSSFDTIARAKVQECPSLILPVLTALVRKDTEKDLELALSIVKKLKTEEQGEEGSVYSWIDALRHLLYLKDVDELMNAALGMYDFDLVTLVASQSNKDPKEYLAFLNQLLGLETSYQYFRIDKHLCKWESALEHLVLCQEESYTQELIDFIKEKKLFRIALKLLQRNSDRWYKVAQEYGEHLLAQRHYDEAGTFFFLAKDYQNALCAHHKALSWTDCIQDAQMLHYSNDEMKDMLLELCSSLRAVGRHRDEATLLINHLNSHADAVRALCAGRIWKDAICVACSCNELGLIDSCVRPAAVDHAEYLLQRVKAAKEEFDKHTLRLALVRAVEKQNHEDGDFDGHRESDLYSDTSSVTGSVSSTRSSGGSSTSSQRSSKNRRKHERKLFSLKEGSQHEELALMLALHQCITSVFALRDETRQLCSVLLQLEEYQLGAQLQQLLASTLKEMESKFNIIWPPMTSPGTSSECQMIYGPNATANMLAAASRQPFPKVIENLHLLEPQFRYAPVIHTLKWELEFFRV